MHAQAPIKDERKWWEKYTRYGYLIGAILLHLILLLIFATLVIWKAPDPPPQAQFGTVNVKVPPPPPAPPPPAGAAANNPQVEPQVVTVPPVTPPSVVTMNVSSAFQVDSARLMHAALSHVSIASPQSTGLGGGSSTGGVSSNYGSIGGDGADGFVGTLYDLKQTPDRKPTDMAENASELSQNFDQAWFSFPSTQRQLEFLRKFVVSWDASMLDDYYKSPNALSATQICIPIGPSVNAPKAYNCDGVVRARRWIAIYHAKVISPETGRYRFIGRGDDFLVVRIDGVNVLDGSLDNEVLDSGASTKEDVGNSSSIDNAPNCCGTWVDFQAGISVDMSVMIGEGPGGSSGFILMVQKEGDNSAKGDYPVFQLRDGPVPDGGPPSKKKILFQIAH